MYVVVTSKPGVYKSSLNADAKIVEAYEYYFYDRHLATFHLAELLTDGYVEIVEDKGEVNRVPTKFLEAFDTLEEAKAEINELISFGNLEVRLEKIDNPTW